MSTEQLKDLMRTIFLVFSVLLLTFHNFYPMTSSITVEDVMGAVRARDIKKLRSFKGKVDFSMLKDPVWGSSPLFWAININAPEVVEFLLTETNIDVNTPNQRNSTPLLFAVEEPGKMNIVRLLLAKKGINLDHRGASFMTALERADEEYIGILRTAGAQEPLLEPNMLSCAITLNKKWIIEKFINEAPHIIEPSSLLLAIWKKQTNIVSLFAQKLFHGSLVRMERKDSYHAIDFAEFFETNPDVNQLVFINKSCKVTHIMNNPETVTCSLEKKDARLMGVIIRDEASYGVPKEEAGIIVLKLDPAFHLDSNEQSTSSSSSEGPQYCHLPDKELNKAFAKAVRKNLPAKVRELALQGANINQLFDGTETAAHFAIATENRELFDAIISAPHFNQNAKSITGNTLIMYVLHLTGLAVPPREFIRDCMVSLLQLGNIDTDAVNNAGHSVWNIVRANNISISTFGITLYDSAESPIPIKITGTDADPIPDKYKGIRLPPGTYSQKEFETALEQRHQKLLEEKKEKKCAQCQKDSHTRCGKCRKVYYCSPECQRNHWPTHREEFHKPQSCSICLETVVDSRQESCGHQFHEECIKTWIKIQGKDPHCPVCKEKIEMTLGQKQKK